MGPVKGQGNNVKLKVKILSNLVGFLENMNFTFLCKMPLFHSRGKVCLIDIPGSQIVIGLGFSYSGAPGTDYPTLKNALSWEFLQATQWGQRFFFLFDYMKHFQFLTVWKNRKYIMKSYGCFKQGPPLSFKQNFE